jgi:structure-specific endonuclease subunit SLX1
MQDQLSYALCVADTDCTSTSHLACLAQNRADPAILLPTTVSCPGCHRPNVWGELIRGCYARRESVAKEAEKAAKRARKALAANSDTDMSSMSQDSSLSSPQRTPAKSARSRTRRKEATPRRQRPSTEPENELGMEGDSESSEEEWARFEREMMAMS